MPGSKLSAEEIELCLSAISSLKPLPPIIIASGSLPPGVPNDFFARLAVMSKQKGIKLIVDTSGTPLRLAAQEGVFLPKPSLSEMAASLGRIICNLMMWMMLHLK